MKWVVLLLVDVCYFILAGSVGIVGSAVKSVQTHYDLDNDHYNVLYYGPGAVYLVSMPIWMHLLDRYKWTRLFSWATGCIAIGFGVQCLYKMSFYYAVAGACFSSIGTVFVLTSSSMIVNRWFTPEEKSMAYGSLFFSGQLGVIVSFLIGRLLIRTPHAFVQWYLPLMVVYAGLATFLFLMTFTLKEKRDNRIVSRIVKTPKVALRKSDETAAPTAVVSLPADDDNDDEDDPHTWINPPRVSAKNQPHLILYIVVYILVSGPNWTISALLTERLTDTHDHATGLPYDDNTILTAWLLFSGVALTTPLIIGRILDATHQYRVVVLSVMVCVTAAYIPWILTFQYRIPCLFLTAFLGLVTGANTTMFVETAIELAYPVDAKYWAPLMIYFAQLFAFICTVGATYHITNQYAIWTFGAIFAAATLVLGIDLKFAAPYARYSTSK